MDFDVNFSFFPLLFIPIMLAIVLTHVIIMYLNVKQQRNKYISIILIVLLVFSFNIYKYVNVGEFYFWSKIFSVALLIYIGVASSFMLYSFKLKIFEKLILLIIMLLLCVCVVINEVLSGFISVLILIPLGIWVIYISLIGRYPTLIRGIFILLIGLFSILGFITNDKASVFFVSTLIILGILYEIILYFYSVIKLLKVISIQSIKDPLTNLYNKNYLLNKLEYLISREEIDVMYIAIDNSTHLNDVNSAENGDIILKKISSILLKQTGDLGFSSLYSEKEIVTVLRDGEVEKIVGKFKVKIENELDIKVSIGSANSLERSFDSAKELLEMAKRRTHNAN